MKDNRSLEQAIEELRRKRAIEILTPGTTRFSPAEYEEALAMAREALAKDTNVPDKDAGKMEGRDET